ncbi:fluoride efflux transporter CrcB [Aliarcobacter skirrowii]|jgi:CrcB protein|uniref:Fluoride-specific ion channel FluC n=2 Tax=Aliarcobacter skirrowii TaxID=28200 RepID=A0AAD0SNW6_9BACT|nr:fluoride efflux transporter CrcB [Aliarcobacter skirrowii]AXX85593.1 putative fluoride ion transporter [Aliarcobacter skirrowii CCUG 10374]AZL54655.1 fluoride efflux transporter CrcB [Aliarcobacter skirrowii]KAB0620998.1 fluoride efflux transporter CrcB [Aliarcobacter skirrowii CCUG 10374]MDX4028195.1 fluoride efflux transporter CrcB [Aliarcobacter skirrowii]MDX4038808.1 fluoride efflux transporter CrcB [Aliarcobacter skirrowii]
MFLEFKTLIAIGIGGAVGSILRAITVFYQTKYYPVDFPLGILIVNILGSLILGFVYFYISNFIVSENVRFLIITGFLGGLTTFSTFALDSYLLLNSSLNLAILNIILNISGSIFAIFLGVKIAQFIFK